MIFLADVITVALFAFFGLFLESIPSKILGSRFVSAPVFGAIGLAYVIFRHWEKM